MMKTTMETLTYLFGLFFSATVIPAIGGVLIAINIVSYQKRNTKKD